MSVQEELRQEYDKAHEITIHALDTVADSDFEKQAHYPDWDPMLARDITLERLFHYIKDHFNSHENQIRQIINIS